MTTTASPQRRMWIWPIRGGKNPAIEVLLFGALDEIAPLFSMIHSAAERCPELQRVEIIASGTTVAGLRAQLTSYASDPDPIVVVQRLICSLQHGPSVWFRSDDQVKQAEVGEW